MTAPTTLPAKWVSFKLSENSYTQSYLAIFPFDLQIIGRDDASVKDVDRKELKITVKVFISSPKSESLKEALDQGEALEITLRLHKWEMIFTCFPVLNILQTDSIDSLVIAYGKTDNTDLLTSLQSLWTLIEEYVKLGKLSSVGVSDVDTDVFIKLFQWAKVRYTYLDTSLTTKVSKQLVTI